MIASAARDSWRDLESRVRSFVARRVRASADVDDVVQEVLLRVQRGLAGLREDECFGPWVYRVARTTIVDHHRAAGRHPWSDELDLEERTAEDDDDDLGVREALARCLTPFVERLPTPYREALTLAELGDLTQKEAAEALGISVSGMKSRVQRGRAHLRKAVEECCHLSLDGRGRVFAFEPKGPAACRAFPDVYQTPGTSR